MLATFNLLGFFFVHDYSRSWFTQIIFVLILVNSILTNKQASKSQNFKVTIKLAGSFGNVEAFTTKDTSYGLMIGYSIRQAIAQRAASAALTDKPQATVAIDWPSVPLTYSALATT